MTTPDPVQLLAQLRRPGLPPVERWNPPLSGAMDLRIARDGSWWHDGRRIEREALVRLFAGILRCDEDGVHYLVTPVEKWRIEVDDAPFVAVLVHVEGSGREQRLRFVTNLGDEVQAGAAHPLGVEYRGDEPAPYVHVRGRLRALLARAVFVELAAHAEPGEVDGRAVLGVWSDGAYFVLGPAD